MNGCYEVKIEPNLNRTKTLVLKNRIELFKAVRLMSEGLCVLSLSFLPTRL